MLCTVLGLSSGKLGFCGNIYLVNFTMDSGEKPFHCQGQVKGFYNKTNICMLWRYIQILSLYTHIVCNEDMNNASHRFPLGAKKKKKCNCGWTSAFIIVKAKHLINETAAQGFKCKALWRSNERTVLLELKEKDNQDETYMIMILEYCTYLKEQKLDPNIFPHHTECRRF